MPPKPVVLINHLYEPRDKITGITSYLFSLLAALLDRGAMSYVLATNWTPSALPAELRRADLTLEPSDLPESTPRNILAQMRLVPRLMHRHGASLEFNVNPVGGVAGRWPRVVTVHDLYFDVNPASYKARHLLWWRLLFPLSHRRARAVICVSEQTRADLVRFHRACAGKAIVVHEAGPVAVGGAEPAARRPYGLFVANVSPNKGGDVLAEALADLDRRGAPIEVLHVGRDEAGVFPAARRRLGAAAGPRPLGRVDRDALLDLFAHASFLAFPSTYEGFGLPILEAQAYGVPVIATDIPVLREVAGAGALFFPAGDAAALAGHMEALMADPSLWFTLHRAALANTARFSWSKAAGETEEVFRAVLGRR